LGRGKEEEGEREGKEEDNSNLPWPFLSTVDVLNVYFEICVGIQKHFMGAEIPGFDL
jgi:hypothetical protein